MVTDTVVTVQVTCPSQFTMVPGMDRVDSVKEVYVSINAILNSEGCRRLLPPVLLDFSITAKAAPHECVIRTSRL